jgi:uncharacterized membrane protein YdjX (TVP38/TMEM64 family)
MTVRKKFVSFALILSILLLTINTETMSVVLSGDAKALKDLSNMGLLLLLLNTLLLMTIQNMFTIIPLILLISANVALFGFAGGYIWSWLVSIIGAVVSFAITRFWFQDFFAKFVDEEWERKIDEKGFWFVFIGRVMPFIPTSVVNIAAAISSVRFMKFFYATALGNLIYFFILSSIALGVLSIPVEYAIYIVLAIIAFLIFLAINRRKKKQGDRHLPL